MSASGFIFEEVMEVMLKLLQPCFEKEGFTVTILGEQQIRDKFNEQSLNGVDHYFELKSFDQHYLFLMQEKWKIVTNQREVSQFLDCSARIRARQPEFHGRLFRLWVTRTPPSENGAKSLEEGAAYVIQSTTSMTMLAQNAGLFICELIQKRHLSQEMSMKMPSYFMSDKPLEAMTRDLQVKELPPPTFKASKVKISVRKEEEQT
jgi:hypothetical protein